jgi:hypothetical protein
MKTTPVKTSTSEEDVLRRMLNTPPTPHKSKVTPKKKKTGK